MVYGAKQNASLKALLGNWLEDKYLSLLPEFAIHLITRFYKHKLFYDVKPLFFARFISLTIFRHKISLKSEDFYFLSDLTFAVQLLSFISNS